MNRDSKGLPTSPSPTPPSNDTMSTTQGKDASGSSHIVDSVSNHSDKGASEDTAKTSNQGKSQKSLKEKAQEAIQKNPSALGDPVSLKAETKSDENRQPEGDKPKDSATKSKL